MPGTPRWREVRPVTPRRLCDGLVRCALDVCVVPAGHPVLQARCLSTQEEDGWHAASCCLGRRCV